MLKIEQMSDLQLKMEKLRITYCLSKAKRGTGFVPGSMLHALLKWRERRVDTVVALTVLSKRPARRITRVESIAKTKEKKE